MVQASQMASCEAKTLIRAANEFTFEPLLSIMSNSHGLICPDTAAIIAVTTIQGKFSIKFLL